MTRRTIQTNSAPDAIGPYSQGVAAGGLVFTSIDTLSFLPTICRRRRW
jgi:enamine deaminase RidA (YjgF/YER057c/UK114 family)